MIQMNSFPFFFYILTGLKTWILKPSKFLFLFLIKCYISVLKSRKKASKVINDYTHICVVLYGKTQLVHETHTRYILVTCQSRVMCGKYSCRFENTSTAYICHVLKHGALCDKYTQYTQVRPTT